MADVWSRGYGDGDQISWLFLGLLLAAGIGAYPVLGPHATAFRRQPDEPSDLNTNVVLVVLDGKELYLDPVLKLHRSAACRGRKPQ